MRVRTYDLLRECVEHGVRYGLSKCAKYNLDRESEAFAQRVADETMSAIAERFDWDDEVS